MLRSNPSVIAIAATIVSSLLSEAIALGDGITFRRHVVNGGSEYSAVAVFDVNGDGRQDIVCGGWWYEAPTWKKHFVRNVERIRGRFDGYSHLPLDVNADGLTDVVTVNYRSRSIRWLEHPGNDALASGDEWPIHTAEEPGAMETGRLHDIDGDGRLDVLANGQHFAAWWEVTAEDGVAAWTRNELPVEAGGHGLGFGDLNGDGRGDLVGPRGWAQAPLDPRRGRWIWHQELNLGRASFPVLVVDVDDDGDNDLVWTRAHGFGVYWTEQSPSEKGDRKWTHHTIDSTWSQCHSPLWADMDGDGRAELIAGKRYMAHEGRDPGAYDPLCSYRYEYERATGTWRRSTISFGERVGFGLDPKVTDLDNDGDLDLVVCGRSGLYWLENMPAAKSSSVANAALRDSPPPPDGAGADSSLAKPETPFAWGRMRHKIITGIESELGQLPQPHERVPLEIEVVRESNTDGITGGAIRFDTGRGRVEGQLWQPMRTPPEAVRGMPGVVVIGLTDEVTAESVARHGYACLAAGIEASESIDDIWKCMRCVDVLESLPNINAERIGLVGIGDRAKLAVLAAAVDQRFVATFVAGEFSNWDRSVAYSPAEVVAAVSPRAVTLRPLARPSAELTLVQQAVEQSQPAFAANRFSQLPTVEAMDVAVLSSLEPMFTWLDERLLRRP